MSEQTISGGDCSCPEQPRKTAANWSLAGGILIALLPKCPFCLLAYSSAMTMCSGATTFDHRPGWFSFVSIVLALVVIGTIVRNYRGPRSAFALALALSGAASIAYSELVSGRLSDYYPGAYMLLAAALLNGGLWMVLRSWWNRRFALSSR